MKPNENTRPSEKPLQQWGELLGGDIDEMRFDRNFDPTRYHSISDVGFSGPDGIPDEADAQILKEVQDVVSQSLGAPLELSTIQVQVLHGVVTLIGTANDTKTIDLIEKNTALVFGVKEIRNQVVKSS